MLKMTTEINIKSNLKTILAKIEAATLDRPVEFNQSKIPQLVAVSKFKPVDLIIEAYNAGQTHFGENYVQEFVEKANNSQILEKCKNIKWHFIGHLQGNKINKVLSIPNLHIIETVDSKKLVDQLNKNWPNFAASDLKLNIMIQVNTSREENKNGIPPENVNELSAYVLNQCPNLKLNGLMTIGKFDHDTTLGPNPDFLCLKKCRDDLCKELKLDCKELDLSMGMSNDFEEAIKFGSTNVRVGTSIFGERVVKK